MKIKINLKERQQEFSLQHRKTIIGKSPNESESIIHLSQLDEDECYINVSDDGLLKKHCSIKFEKDSMFCFVKGYMDTMFPTYLSKGLKKYALKKDRYYQILEGNLIFIGNDVCIFFL